MHPITATTVCMCACVCERTCTTYLPEAYMHVCLCTTNDIAPAAPPPQSASLAWRAPPCSFEDRLAFAELRIGDTAITSSSPAASLVANPLCWRLDGYGTNGTVYDYGCSGGPLTGRYVTVQNFSPWTVKYPPWDNSIDSLALHVAEV